MHNLLSTLKWTLITAMILLWLGLCLMNREEVCSLVIIPGYLAFQRVPLSVTLIFPLLVAFVVFTVVGMLDQVDHFLQARELKKRIRDLEQEVTQLRNLPIRESLLSQRTLQEENRT
ncbi:MAG: hypothetical protein ACP5VF_05200 [Acidobacteriota bacterium]|jgi:hypothetical protein